MSKKASTVQGVFFQCWLTQDQLAELDSYLGRKPVVCWGKPVVFWGYGLTEALRSAHMVSPILSYTGILVSSHGE